MNDRPPTAIERHPWLVLPVVLLAGLLTALLRPVPVSGEPSRVPALPAGSVAVLPRTGVHAAPCHRPVPEGPGRPAVTADRTVRRALHLASVATSADAGRAAIDVARSVAGPVRTGEVAPLAVRCPTLPPLPPNALLAIL